MKSIFNGIEEAVKDINSCPAGFGVLAKLDLRTMKIETASDCSTRRSCPAWRNLQNYELSLGWRDRETDSEELNEVAILRLADAAKHEEAAAKAGEAGARHDYIMSAWRKLDAAAHASKEAGEA